MGVLDAAVAVVAVAEIVVEIELEVGNVEIVQEVGGVDRVETAVVETALVARMAASNDVVDVHFDASDADADDFVVFVVVSLLKWVFADVDDVPMKVCPHHQPHRMNAPASSLHRRHRQQQSHQHQEDHAIESAGEDLHHYHDEIVRLT